MNPSINRKKAKYILIATNVFDRHKSKYQNEFTPKVFTETIVILLSSVLLFACNLFVRYGK